MSSSCKPGTCFNTGDATKLLDLFRDTEKMNKKPNCINILLFRYYTENTNNSIIDNDGKHYDYIMGIYNDVSPPSTQQQMITLREAYSTN